MTTQEILTAIEGMTVLELNELVKEMQDRWGVSPMAAVAAAPAAAEPAEKPEEKTAFDVILTAFGAEKIKVIKVVRELTNLGLKEAKELVEGVPKPLKEGVTKDDAAAMKAKIEEVGGSIEVK